MCHMEYDRKSGYWLLGVLVAFKYLSSESMLRGNDKDFLLWVNKIIGKTALIQQFYNIDNFRNDLSNIKYDLYPKKYFL